MPASVDVERYPEREVKPIARRRVELATSPAKHTLGDREEVVAVHDAVARESVLNAKWNLRRDTANRSRHGSDRNVGEHWYRAVASHDHDGTSAFR
jgi:hypothetical protein